MQETRRQTMIIAVLIVLIAIAGVFAKRFNESAKDTNALNTEANHTGKSMALQELRITHQNERNALMQNYEAVSKDDKQTEQARNEASKKYMELASMGSKENEVETKLKEMGFEDVLCIINDNGVEVYIKGDQASISDQGAEIMDAVVKTTKFLPRNVSIKPAE